MVLFMRVCEYQGMNRCVFSDSIVLSGLSNTHDTAAIKPWPDY